MSLETTPSLMLTGTLAAILGLAGCASPSAEATTDTSAVEAPVVAGTDLHAIDFLVGKWHGGGTLQLGPGQQQAFVEDETVEPQIDGVAVTVEGLGKDATDGTVVHQAFGVVFHDERGFRMRWFADNGSTDDSEVVVGDHTVAWTYDLGSRRARFTIQVTPDGRWVETGATTPDGGTTWVPFFAMTLDRVSR